MYGSPMYGRGGTPMYGRGSVGYSHLWEGCTLENRVPQKRVMAFFPLRPFRPDQGQAFQFPDVSARLLRADAEFPAKGRDRRVGVTIVARISAEPPVNQLPARGCIGPFAQRFGYENPVEEPVRVERLTDHESRFAHVASPPSDKRTGMPDCWARLCARVRKRVHRRKARFEAPDFISARGP